MSNKGTALNIKYQILLKIIKPLFKHLLISGKTIFFFLAKERILQDLGNKKIPKPTTQKATERITGAGFLRFYASIPISKVSKKRYHGGINIDYILGNQGSRSSITTEKLCFRSSAYFTLPKFKTMYIIFICSKNIYLSIKRSRT